MPSSVLGNHLHEGSQLRLHGNDLQIEGLHHPGVHLTHHPGAVLTLRLFVADQTLLLSGVGTHLLAGDHYLQLEGVLLLHHLGGIGHRCVLHLEGDVAAHHHAGAPQGLLGGARPLQGG